MTVQPGVFFDRISFSDERSDLKGGQTQAQKEMSFYVCQKSHNVVYELFLGMKYVQSFHELCFEEEAI